MNDTKESVVPFRFVMDVEDIATRLEAGTTNLYAVYLAIVEGSTDPQMLYPALYATWQYLDELAKDTVDLCNVEPIKQIG